MVLLRLEMREGEVVWGVDAEEDLRAAMAADGSTTISTRREDAEEGQEEEEAGGILIISRGNNILPTMAAGAAVDLIILLACPSSNRDIPVNREAEEAVAAVASIEINNG